MMTCRPAANEHVAKTGTRVVGPDRGPTPPDLSSRSLFQWRRERERAWYTQFFFGKYTPSRAIQRQSFVAINGKPRIRMSKVHL